MRNVRVGITHGDINGIGYELILKALSAPEMLELCTPIIFGDANIAKQAAKTFQTETPVELNVIKTANDYIEGRANLVQVCKNETTFEWGQRTEASLEAEAASLQAALEAYKQNLIDVLVCAPGQLDNDVDSHSLSDFIRQAFSAPKSEFDWIINGQVRTLMLHPFNFSTELAEGMAREAFMNDMRLISKSLQQDFGLMRPRIAVVSHLEKLESDIRELQEQGLVLFGPFEGKTFLEEQRWEHYDAVLFLEQEEERHRLLQNELIHTESYGYLGGVPLVLTYPIESVSYEIAGQGKASEVSLRQAIYSAIDIYRKRGTYHWATRKPLEKQWIPKGRDDFKLDLTAES